MFAFGGEQVKYVTWMFVMAIIPRADIYFLKLEVMSCFYVAVCSCQQNNYQRKS